jgi:hypothetical protein
MSLNGIASKIAWLKHKANEDPYIYFRPTPPQKAWIESPAKVKALIGGNQVGKTAAACYLLIAHCLNRHPTIKTDPAPIEAWLITHSHEQSRTIQQKLFDMIPKYELHPSCEFIRGKGFRGLAPLVRFQNNSIIRIKTAAQGIGLESASVSLVVIDEPVNSTVFNTCIARTLRGGAGGKQGTVAISMTPVGNVDVTYMKDMIEQGKIACFKAPLTVESTTPIGCKPLLTQEQIDDVTSKYLPVDREQRITGSFDVAPIGVVFDNFDPDTMIFDGNIPQRADRYKLCIGIDHGSTPNSQVVILSCIVYNAGQQPFIYVLDEYVSGQAPPETHVTNIIQMCKRNRITPEQVESWTGDGTHHAKRSRDGFRMSNILLMRAFEHQLKYPPRGLPFTIRRPIKWRHSVYFTASLIHANMSRKQFFIHRRCTHTIKSLKNWTMQRTQSARSTDTHGHAIDALRYCVTSSLDTRPDRNQRIRVT